MNYAYTPHFLKKNEFKLIKLGYNDFEQMDINFTLFFSNNK